MSLPLDDTDRRLLALLQGDARLPVSSLAATLKLARGTVQNRIDRLIESGVLLGFTTRMRSDAGDASVRAVTSIELRGHDERKTVAALRRIPEVTSVYTTNGRWDLVAELAAADLPSLDRVLRDIRSIKEISNSETSILLSREK